MNGKESETTTGQTSTTTTAHKAERTRRACHNARRRGSRGRSAGGSRQGQPAAAESVVWVDHHLVTQRKRLEDIEPIWAIRWLLRKYFAWRGFACRSHCGECDGKCYASIEYRGTFSDPVDAYWAANCDPGAVKPIPFNALLPEQTVSYKPELNPQSEVAADYRKGVLLPFVAVPRSDLECLQQTLKESRQVIDECRMAV